MKRFARVVAGSAAMGAAMLTAATASITWSQSTTRPSTAAPQAATQPQPPQQQGVVGGGGGGDRDGRSAFRGGYGDRRYEGRGDGMRPPTRMEWRRGSIPDGRPENFTEPTPEEWKEIEAFMKAHSPERLARLEDVGDDQRQQGVRNMFAARYRALQELKERDPQMYQIRVARMPIEDRAFDLSWKLTHNEKEAKADELKAQLRAQLRLLVKSRLDERALRLQHMEKHLAEFRQTLKDDEQRIDELVDSNLADVAEDRLPRDLRPQLMPRRERPRTDDNATDSNATPADP